MLDQSPEIEIIPPDGGYVDVIACPHPFELRRVELKVRAGHTLSEIIEIVQPIKALRHFAHCAIGDEIIYRDRFNSVRPKPGTRVLVRMLPTGGMGKKGGGGGKNPLSIIVSIVALVAAIVVPALIPAIAGIAIAGSLTVGTLISGAILVVGGIISNQLAAPAKQGKLAALSMPEVSQDRGSPTLSITGARNSVRPNSVIASVLGVHWQVPAMGAPPYTEFIGEDQYLIMNVVWGIGPLHVTQVKIGETPIDAFQDVYRETKRGYQPNQITIRPGWDAASGIFPVDPVFGDRWTVISAGTIGGINYVPGDTITYNGIYGRSDPLSWDINEDKLFSFYPYDVVEQSEQITMTPDWQTRTTSPNTDQIVLDYVFFRGLTRFNDQGKPIPHSVLIHAEYQPVAGGAWIAAPDVNVTGAQVDAVRVSQRWNVSPRGQYNVRFRRDTLASTDTRLVDDCALTSMKSIRFEPPFDHRGATTASPAALCCEVIRIKATDQLQGVIDDLSGICHTMCKDWNGTSWVWRMSNNPASLFRHVYQGPATAMPLADSEINLADLQYWHSFCDLNNYRFNHIVDYPSTVEQMAADIAASSRSSVTRRDNKVTVVIDEPAAAPVQAFTPRNSWDFRSEIQYPDLPHAFRAKFVDNLTGKQLERICYDDGQGEHNSYLFESLDLTGVTDPHQVYKLARYHIATARLRRQSISFRTDMEGLVCTRGDLIRFTHDVPLWGLHSGRVTDTLIEGNAIVGVRIDEAVVMEEGKSYSVRFRKATSAMLETAASVVSRPGENRTLPISPISLDAVGRGDIFWFGETGQEHRDLRVHAIIDPQPDMSAKFICIEDNPSVYYAELGPIPAYDPGISTGVSILYPRIISVRSDGSIVFKNAAGQYDNRILVVYSRPSGTMAAQIDGVEVHYYKHGMTTGHATPVAKLAFGEISLTEVDTGATYDIYIRFVRKDGSRGIWAPAVTHTVIADEGAPPDIIYFVVTRMSDGTRRFEWRMVLEPAEVVSGGGYRIKYSRGTSFAWDVATDLSTAGLIQSSPWEMNDLSAGIYTFGIKAVTASGIESTAARTLTVELGDPRQRNVLLQSHEHLINWPGERTNCFVWGDPPVHLHAAGADGSRWETQGLWTTMAGVKWQDLPRVSPISYTTLVLSPALGRNVTFSPRVEVDGDDITAVEMRAGPKESSGNLFGYSWGPLAQVVQQAYVQFRVTATGPKINTMIITIDGELAIDDIEDVNTLTTTASWFQRLGPGWFRVAARSPIAVITGASIRAIQSGNTSWSWWLITKSTQVGANPAPAAEFAIYNGGIATDAVVDIELKGPLL